jgi:cyanophycinase-like exopeptidase
MDAAVLQLIAGGDAPVRVVVTALAGAPGREVDTADAHGVAYYRALGADAVAAPDARQDPDGALAQLATAQLVVLPGGSPARLLDALQQTPVGGWLVEAVRNGTAVSGASAGAMVLCGWTVLPDRSGPHGPAVVPGLGIVEGAVVVPHWNGGRDDWLRSIAAGTPDGTEVLGLAEQSGVLLRDGELAAVGTAPVRLLATDRDLVPGDTRRLGGGGPQTAS